MARIEGIAGVAPVGLDVAAAYDQHAPHVWASLHRLGVRGADLPDLAQEVFVVAHRRRTEFDGVGSVRGWLWGICVGLARNYRRRAFRRAERFVTVEAHDERDPERALLARRRMERALDALDALDPELRAVFVMFEVEGMSGREIAAALEVPLGTVHSRLHGARIQIAAALREEER